MLTEVLKKHPALLITASYLYFCVIGFSYSVGLYRSFGINCMEYMKLGDFLISAFKSMQSIALSLIAFVTSLFMFSIIQGVSRLVNILQVKKRVSIVTAIIFGALYTFLLPTLVGQSQAKSIIEGSVEYTFSYRTKSMPNYFENRFFIGGLEGYLFFYEAKDKSVEIVSAVGIEHIKSKPLQ